jgi:type I restriction enzyme S subunit
MMEMEDIKRVQLSEIVELITKGTTPTTLGYEFQDEGVNFLKIECFDENGGSIESKVAHISEECHKKMKRSQLKNGDILFSIAGAIGRVAIVTEEMLPANINQALAIIRISDEQVYLPYIKLILTSPIVIEQFERKKQGVAQLNLSLKDINEISIPLPGKDKQIELAELFNKVVGVISKRNKELSVLDDLIKARFVEMFGNPDLNEKEWDINKMERLCEVSSSKRIYQNEQSVIGIPFLRISDLVNRMDTGSKECDLYIPEEKYEELKDQGLVPIKGDILLTARGTLGRCYIIQENDEFYFQDGMITWLSNFNEKITSLYIAYLFSMPGFRKQIDALQAGSTVAYLSISMTKKLDIMVPPIELQNQFADFVHQVDKSKVVEIIN